jgi:hypothetical protein
VAFVHKYLDNPKGTCWLKHDIPLPPLKNDHSKLLRYGIILNPVARTCFLPQNKDVITGLRKVAIEKGAKESGYSCIDPNDICIDNGDKTYTCHYDTKQTGCVGVPNGSCGETVYGNGCEVREDIHKCAVNCTGFDTKKQCDAMDGIKHEVGCKWDKEECRAQCDLITKKETCLSFNNCYYGKGLCQGNGTPFDERRMSDPVVLI